MDYSQLFAGISSDDMRQTITDNITVTYESVEHAASDNEEYEKIVEAISLFLVTFTNGNNEVVDGDYTGMTIDRVYLKPGYVVFQTDAEEILVNDIEAIENGLDFLDIGYQNEGVKIFENSLCIAFSNLFIMDDADDVVDDNEQLLYEHIIDSRTKENDDIIDLPFIIDTIFSKVNYIIDGYVIPVIYITDEGLAIHVNKTYVYQVTIDSLLAILHNAGLEYDVNLVAVPEGYNNLVIGLTVKN